MANSLRYGILFILLILLIISGGRFIRSSLIKSRGLTGESSPVGGMLEMSLHRKCGVMSGRWGRWG